MPTHDRILTGSASAGEEASGKAKRTANSECQKEIAETRPQKALEEKKRLDARTVKKVATESEERVPNL
jgi:hypothetical protein